MARKRYSRPIDILAAAAADDQVHRINNNHTTTHDDAEQHSGSQPGSELNKLSGSDPDSMVSPRSKSSRKRSFPKHLMLNEIESLNKKAKEKARGDGSGCVNRVWSEQDEIAILRGMIEFRLRRGEDVYSDMNAFLAIVQETINVHVSKKQLTDKIRRLKNRYFVNVDRNAERIGNVVVKEHEAKMFELAVMVWGGEGVVRGSKDKEDGNVVENGGIGGNVVENGEKEKDDVAENGGEGDDVEGGNVVENGENGNVDDKEDEGRDFRGMYPYLSRAWEGDVSCSVLMKSYLMDNVCAVGSAELREMDKNWKGFYVEQLKLYVKRLDLEKANAQVVLRQLETSDP